MVGGNSRNQGVNTRSHNKPKNAVKKRRIGQRRKKCTNLHHVQDLTEYFTITSLKNNVADFGYNSQVPLEVDCYADFNVDSDFANEKNLIIEDDFFQLDNDGNNKVFVKTSPHRIKMCSTLSNIRGRPESPLLLNYDIKRKLIKKEEKKGTNDHKLTEYFPVRRSVRKTKRIILEEKQKEIEKLLKSEVEEGLQVHNFEGKGRGIIATRPFNQGDYVVEYSGELVDVAEAKEREIKYERDLNTGCYMYYFKHQNQQYCVDATAESGKLGRLVNHSRNGNLITRTVIVDRIPRLVLIAKEDIQAGDEITYDYGDRSKESLKHHPWLAF